VKRLGHISSGHLVVFGYGGGPYIYDVAEHDVLDHLVVPLATYADLAIPGGADYAAALRFDGTVDVITAADIPEVRTVIQEPEARAVAMDGAGTTLAIAFRSEIMLLDLPSEDVLHRIHVPDASILDIQLSDDGALLAAGLHDGTSHVWRTSDGSHALHLHGHKERVASVAFDRDANLLATGSWDHTTRIWDLSVIDRTSDELLDEVSRRWQLELEDALASRP
jgi:WD40 repeat protein